MLHVSMHCPAGQEEFVAGQEIHSANPSICSCSGIELVKKTI